ncbi:PPOX class F420-dependent oxidoreductase [Nocardia spumae]|uniref:PPOX class F420-dependent oxidoreductase n=1 Tax=Nocardia spumae TaxID=2887190 RepID=UPI001D136B07|nr:PPOX class F420-dependent oxidoreductase [Nocardia spumae]
MTTGSGGFAIEVSIELSAELKKILDTTKVFATLATIGRDGQPHLTVIWLDRDGDELVYSTTVARAQYKNVVRDPRVTVMINPPDAPYLYAEIRGTATITPDPERAMPDRLSAKYTGQPYAEFNPASVDDAERVIVRVTPQRINGRL